MTDLDQEWCMTHNRCQVNCKMNDKQIQKLKNQGGKIRTKVKEWDNYIKNI